LKELGRDGRIKLDAWGFRFGYQVQLLSFGHMERDCEDTQSNKLREGNHWCIHTVCPVVPSLLIRPS
jgi:hypothetical protein